MERRYVNTVQKAKGKGQRAEGKNTKKFLISFLLFTIHCSLFTVFYGCQQDSPAPSISQPVVSEVKKEIAKSDIVAPIEETQEEKKVEPIFEIKRNPFKPYIVKVLDKPTVVLQKKPLQRYDVEQLKLVAIIWGIANPTAMVETPDGKGYSVKKGALLGNRNGIIKRVEKDQIIVEEKFVEETGEVQVNEIVIKLPLAKGEEDLQ